MCLAFDYFVFLQTVVQAIVILVTQKTISSKWKKGDVGMAKPFFNKTLGRARDPRANGAWLSKLTEWNMKCLS